MTRFDERDTIFSRLLLQEGSREYREYYLKHPERLETDRALRRPMEGLYTGHLTEQGQVEGTFAFLKDIRPLTRGESAPARVPLDPETAVATLRRIARSYGAVLTGIAPADPSFFYAVRGRGSRYGQPVEPDLDWAIITAVEMAPEELAAAPAVREAVEVTRGYARAALAAMILSYTIRQMGYKAVCHMDGESEVMMPRAAVHAGLGDYGRMGLLVTREYGPRVRLAAVTTDLPLKADPPESPAKPFSLERVCPDCGKCARACPAGAIPSRRGLGIDHEACFFQWKKEGTDCGLCLAACPFSGIPRRPPPAASHT